MKTTTQYETIIGLEVHLQLKTATKIFCSCSNLFGLNPNSQTCPVCLGLPGTLPVLNKKALEYAIKVALALNCEVNSFVKFDRKNYYYPDLPKGYQISQFDKPIASNGYIFIQTADGKKKISIKRAHLEEDAGKLVHDTDPSSSLVDYNRTGTPLIEIVTEPDLRTAQEAFDYLQTLKLILQYLDASDCDMEKGSLRCDANISLREIGATKLGTKTEVKNMNSFRAVKAALEFEENRQRQMLDSGERIIQETRLWNEEKQLTIAMRSKEEAHDYRYFPEPDLVPFEIDARIIQEARQNLPELPEKKLQRFMQAYNLSEYDVKIIIQDKAMADYFEACAKEYKEFKKIANWLNGPLLQEVNNRKTTILELGLKIHELISLIKKIDDGTISNLAAKDILKFSLDEKKNIDQVIQEKGLAQVSDESALEKIVDEIIAANPAVVEQIKSGKDSAAGFLVGQAMKKSQGKGNPKKFGDIIKRRLHG